MSIVGPLVDAGQIEAAVIRALKTWLRSYIVEVAAQNSFKGPIEKVKSWAVASEYDRWPEQGLPAVIVAAPGLLGEPTKAGGEFYRASWSVEVSVTVAAAKAPRARRLAQMYGAAVRGALLQRRSLGDDLQATDWLDEDSGDVAHDKRRTVVVVQNAFAVEHSRIVAWRKGPKGDKPPDSMPQEYPTVQEIDVETEIEE